jgi:hypothetical protein
MIRRLIRHWQRRRFLRALRIVANSALCQDKQVIGLFSFDQHGVLIIGGNIAVLREAMKVVL